ncbi:MAG: AbrB/MazE/SpoVT family DNA-binding domain-containing protein [Nanoarchaeota archaeon]
MVHPKFIGKTKVTTQGQITLPFEGRRDLGIEINSEVYWYELNNCLVVVKDLVNQKDLTKVINKRSK